jgi:predicted  nucleic acid-binding Zn-ribbon protein
MNPELKTLVELQDNLSQQTRITRQLENPETLRAVAGEYAAVLKVKEEHEAALEAARAGKKALEAQAEEKRGQIAALRQQMQMVRNQKEYSAILNSIDQIQRGLTQHDEALKQKGAAEEVQRKALDEILPRWNDISGRHAGLEAQWSGQKRALEEKLEALRHEQKFLERNLPEPVKALFWKTHTLRQGLAVVPVVLKEGRPEHSCSGCHIILRPQQYADVAAGKEIIRCDQCQRILYV